MSKFHRFVRGTFVVLPLASIFADAEPTGISSHDPWHEMILPMSHESFMQESFVEAKTVPSAASLVEKPLNPFTGQIRGKKVRMRANADLESHIVKELDKTELVMVVGEKGDFFAVEAPASSKAYVFRSFILDNVVEGNRVNIRLHPDIEAPVLGQLNNGDQVHGKICQENQKWLEIQLPSSVHFYVAKEFIENIGGPEMKGKIEKKKETATELFDHASFLTKMELRKSFSEMDVEKIHHVYNKIIHDFADFPEYVDQAKDAVVALQDAYMQKRIAFLEAKISGEEVSGATLLREELVALDSIEARTEDRPTDKMLLWEPIEEALYLDWAALHEDHSIQEFYEDQRTASSIVTGTLEPYSVSGVKNKPGSHVLKDKDLPVAYVYSTKVNLENYVGKRVTLRGVERPNNHFAFPAYFVLSQE